MIVYPNNLILSNNHSERWKYNILTSNIVQEFLVENNYKHHYYDKIEANCKYITIPVRGNKEWLIVIENNSGIPTTVAVIQN